MSKYLAVAQDMINLRETQPSQGVRLGTEVGTIINNVVTIIFILGALAVLFMILWGAFEWITSGGDKEKLGGARKRIMTALIGLAILALVFVVIFVVGQVLNFNILGPFTIPSIGNRA